MRTCRHCWGDVKCKATLEKSLEGSHKTSHTLTMQPRNCTPVHLPQRNENIHLDEDSAHSPMYLHCSESLLLSVLQLARPHAILYHQSCLLMLCLHAQSCLTLLRVCDPIDYSPPGFSVHGISQERIPEWVAISFSRGSSQPGIEPGSPALQADPLPSELLGSLHVVVVCSFG